MALIVYKPTPFRITVDLTLTLTVILKTQPFMGYHKVILYTKFEHFGVFSFWVFFQKKNRHRQAQIL